MRPVDASSEKDWKPQVIVVNSGENLAEVVMSFLEQSGRNGYIISATGSVSRVSFRRENTITVTYEGKFEIVSLCGLYTCIESSNQSGKRSAMTVCLSTPDHQLIGGIVNGILITAKPVQIILGTFVAASGEVNGQAEA